MILSQAGLAGEALVTDTGFGDGDTVEGLFSGVGEPKWLPLGKLGTPLALVGAWLLWKKIRGRK